MLLSSLSQEKEMEKQKILYQQARLHARGAAEMVLQMISASKGTSRYFSPFALSKVFIYCIRFPKSAFA